jgi:hypothetical protein
VLGAVQRLDADATHQRGDVLAPDLEAARLEHVAQHAGAGKRVLQGSWSITRMSARSSALTGLGR